MSDLFNMPRIVRQTSLEAYVDALRRAPNLRTRMWHCLEHNGPLTADEIAQALGENILSVRPQVTLLVKEGKIEETGETRPNESGRFAMVWRSLPEDRWHDAEPRLTPAEKIGILKEEIFRLRRMCDVAGIEWREERVI